MLKALVESHTMPGPKGKEGPGPKQAKSGDWQGIAGIGTTTPPGREVTTDAPADTTLNTINHTNSRANTLFIALSLISFVISCASFKALESAG
jgi:hypothetical protein